MASRLAGIEGVRGLAALSVVGYHVWGYNSSDEGFGLPSFDMVFAHLRLGLAAFFMLSGFLLYRPFAAAAMTQAGRPDLWRYTRSRILRIVPAYWTALVVVLLLSPRVFDLPTIAKNFLFVQSYWKPTEWIIYPGWTLCIEMAFYAVLPLIGWASYEYAAVRATTRDRALCCITIPSTFFLLAPFYKILAYAYGWPTHSLPAYLDQFAVGMLLAVAFVCWRGAGSPTPRFLSATLLGTGLLVAAIATSATLEDPRTYASSAFGVLFYEPLMATAFALILSSAIFSEGKTALGSFLAWRPVAWLGLISYGIYIWHSPIIHALNATGGLPTFAWTLPSVAVASIACAAASWYVIERHALALKTGSRARQDEAPLAASVPVARPAHRG